MLLSMLAACRPAAAFLQNNARSSLRWDSIRYAAVLRPMSCASNIKPDAYRCHSTTSLNLLPKVFFSTDLSRSSTVQKSSNDDNIQPTFKKGEPVLAEVVYFGPLGGSVDIVGHNTHNLDNCISQDEPALGRGMILQKEIDYFRRSRGGVDVVKYEILPAYVENVREGIFNEEIGETEVRLDISLRPPGGKAKAEELGSTILQKLKDSGGVLNVGDKSSPEEINEIFPGASKSAFKKAVSGLYRRGLVTPGPTSISLM